MCHPIAMALFDSKEDPIVKFSDHELSLLDSALNNPRQTFNNKELYPTLIEKTAILYYCLIKNHPFKNGNKRIATASLFTFLYINNHWLELEGSVKEVEDYLVETAIKVANSKSSEKDSILADLEDWLRKHIVSEPEKQDP